MSSFFASGVASGDVADRSVVLWTRARRPEQPARPVDVQWRLWSTDADPEGPALRSGTATATAERDHTVHVLVDDLDPGTPLTYEFRCDDDVVRGRTRTLPSRADRLRVAVVCCSRWGWPGFELFASVADERPDLLLHLGDAIYETGEIPPDGPPTLPPWTCRTLADYRQRHRQHRSHPAWQRLLAQVPMLVVWDDHEVADNAPDPGGRERRLAGQRAWGEWMPMRPVAGSLDRRLTIDGLVDLVLVDSRFRGRDPTDVDGPGEPDAPGTILNERQWAWLTQVADDTATPWFVLANQVQVGPMTLAARPALRRPRWRRVVNPDQWDGYPDEQDRLLGVLRRAAGTPVVLSGDLHSGWARRLSDGAGTVAREFTCPSISGLTYHEAVHDRLPVPAGPLARWLRLLNPGIDHLDLTRHGYLVCDITPETFRTTFVTVDGERHVETVDRTTSGTLPDALDERIRDVAQSG